MVQTKKELASTMDRLIVALTDKGNAMTVTRGVVNETVSAFRNSVVELNGSFLVRFGEAAQPAFGSVRKKFPMTVSPGGVVPEAKVTLFETSLDDAGQHGADSK